MFQHSNNFNCLANRLIYSQKSLDKEKSPLCLVDGNKWAHPRRKFNIIKKEEEEEDEEKKRMLEICRWNEIEQGKQVFNGLASNSRCQIHQ